MAEKKLTSVLPDAVIRFFKKPSAPGILLIFVTIVALIWANSQGSNIYYELWQHKITVGFSGGVISKPLLLWINDGLMAIFFFTIGLEIKREIIAGELSTWKKAAMPLFAALGGMIIPAIIFIAFNKGTPASDGWGIPMATDIAFSLGILSLVGKKVPLTLKIFLTAFAIVDDLGAVLIIAFFYSSKIILSNVALGAFFLIVMIIMNWIGVRNKLAYAIPGIAGIWLAFLLSGVHATVAGVLAALVIPASTAINKQDFKQAIINLAGGIRASKGKETRFLSKDEQSVVTSIREKCEHVEPPLQSLEHSLHPLVMFFIMPVFALSNTGVALNTNLLKVATEPSSVGIILGLVIGKPLGIFFFSWLAHKMRIGQLPTGVNWLQIWGVGLLGGIGFTMALFITSLAYSEPALINSAKISILVASVIAGIAGYLILRKTLRH
ncbi:Na+/H+ antiporter NhaA [Niastella populi]|uniref:Na(+)/H(+) antiporter NhaA n=1 Tax=Niastella populi TaxID=550983 RepID=A0A1V9EVQ8_9BACT|nr:Na+/H+ antiporter NhaA [Niastella populi]OQP50237.1 Na+/H+ antiporter NhaA [Niastella populi]